MSMLQAMARRTADFLGRESWPVRWFRPAYESVLDWSSGGQGIPWVINGVSYRIDPRHRHRLGHEYDAAVAAFLRERVRPGALCLDVGANVGVYVLQFAHWSRPNGRVVAFEPNPSACAVLRRHVRLNGLSQRVEVVPAAAGAFAGQMDLYAANADAMSRLGKPNVLIADRVVPIRVPVISLDDFCRGRGWEPDWLFMDIEGFEIAALLGARQLIRNRRKALGVVVEMHPNVWASADTTPAQAAAVLAGLGLRPIPLTGQTDPLMEHGLVYLTQS